MEVVAPPSPNQLKKAQRDAELAKQQEIEAAARSKYLQEREAGLMARGLEYEKEYLKHVEDERQLVNDATESGGFYRPPEQKLIFAIRLKGINKIPPKPRKIMHLFRLLQLHNGVFIKVTKSTMNMLKKIEPYITYGYPSVETVRKLVYERGFVRVPPRIGYGDKQRIRIQSNDVIDEHLGQYGIHGVEDLVHEIYTVGPHFTKANRFLWTFKLNSPRKGFLCKKHMFTEARKGDLGNREEFINDLVERMV